MPRSPRSLAVTEAYRRRLLAIRARMEHQAQALWPSIEQLDRTDWADRMATILAAAQTEAVRVSSAYLTAFLTSELGRPTQGPTLNSRDYSGLSRDGRPLRESLQSPLVGVRAALKEGKTPAEALQIGRNRAKRMVEMDLMAAARNALTDGRERDERFDGFQRAVAGTCGACMALSGEPSEEVHPGCECVSMPRVVGVRDLIPIPTGKELFDRMTPAEQDAQFGADKAQLIRDDEVPISKLIKHERLATDQPNFITERPLDAIQ